LKNIENCTSHGRLPRLPGPGKITAKISNIANQFNDKLDWSIVDDSCNFHYYEIGASVPNSTSLTLVTINTLSTDRLITLLKKLLIIKY
jgi:hypothetical protein